MDINDLYFSPAPADPPAQPETAPAAAPEAADVPGPEPDPAPGEKKKEKSVKQQLTSFGITMVVLCFIMSLLAGAGGAFAMLNFYPLITGDKTEKTTEVTEGEMYQIPVPGAQEDPSAVSEPEATTEAPTQEDVSSVSPGNEEKTKGEIYAEAVNGIVGIRAVKYKQVPSFFGRYSVQTVASTGSGFFVTEDGYIVTNYHVIEDSTEVTVSTFDGSTYAASVRGYEEANDIAVLKIEGIFTVSPIGASSALSVGDDILVIGNPLGSLSYTFTDGVVSYLNRMITGDTGATIHMFQTNAAINEGNSGGPVYNMKGEVVGIASAKYASSSIEGLGFCIPIDDVIGMIRDIIDTGYVTGKPVLGVSVQTVSSAMASRYGLVEGCYIVAIGAGTAAEQAGLMAADVITAIGDTPVASVADISAALMGLTAGDTVNVRVSRGGASLSFAVTLDEYTPGEARTNYSNVYDF